MLEWIKAAWVEAGKFIAYYLGLQLGAFLLGRLIQKWKSRHDDRSKPNP